MHENQKPQIDLNHPPNIEAATRFLKLLDPGAVKFTFQTFDDDAERKKKNTAPIPNKNKPGEFVRNKNGAILKGKDPWAQTYNGTLDQRLEDLKYADENGAGVFITVNETDLKARTAANVKRIRSVFVDLDGAPLEPVLNDPELPKPHAVIRSSPGKWHVYWLIKGLALADFEQVQTKLAERFASDPSVKDLPRVMRLPGFWHHKGEPFQVDIISTSDDPPYDGDEFLKLLGLQTKTATSADDNPFTTQARQGENQWQQLNSEALANLSKWVPKLFPSAAVHNKDSYRISSANLGRNLEEDLSITPQGIKDFGVHDIGDPRHGKRTPIDLVEEWGERDFDNAVEWLHKQLGHEPIQQQQARRIRATPFQWIDQSKIPLREWLYFPHYVRQFCSLTVAPGGVGKTSLLILEMLAMITGRPLLGIEPQQEDLRVWFWNGEEPYAELQRRIGAACKHFKISEQDLGGRLFVDSGHDIPIIMAEQTKSGTKIAIPVAEAVIRELRDNKIDVMDIDPFVSSHRVTENDNMAIEQVAKTWARIAVEANCNISLSHHSRKTLGGGDISIDDSRGAGSLGNAVRAGRVLNLMSPAEAKAIGLSRYQRKSYFRIDSDLNKENMVKPAETATWFKLISVDLENNPFGGIGGDEMQVVTSWQYPQAADNPGVSNSDIRKVQDAIDAGGPFRLDQRSKNEPWVGIVIARVLGLDINIEQGRKAVEQLIREWLAYGYLEQKEMLDASRRPRAVVVVGLRPPDEAPNEAPDEDF